MHLSPAEVVIQTFGGVRATARAIGRSPSSVSKWQKSREKRGSDGSVPSAAQKLLLTAAKRRGLSLTTEDLIYGRTLRARK